jgi:hypothetical protein
MRPVSVTILALLAAAAPAHAKALPTLPTDLGGAQELQVRPAVISFTGDGTGFFGGFTGRRSLGHTRSATRFYAELGRIRLSTWNGALATGTGAVWLNNGIPNDAMGTFHPYPVSLRASDVAHGLFTHLSYRYTAQGMTSSGTLVAHFVQGFDGVPGYWAWPGG